MLATAEQTGGTVLDAVIVLSSKFSTAERWKPSSPTYRTSNYSVTTTGDRYLLYSEPRRSRLAARTPCMVETHTGNIIGPSSSISTFRGMREAKSRTASPPRLRPPDNSLKPPGNGRSSKPGHRCGSQYMANQSHPHLLASVAKERLAKSFHRRPDRDPIGQNAPSTSQYLSL